MSPRSSPKRQLTDSAFSQWDACVKCSRSPRNIFFLGADHTTFEGVGVGVCVISEKNILQTDFDQKNIARRYLSNNGFVCQGKKLSPEVWEKKFLRKPNHPYPATKAKWWVSYLNYFETRPPINRVVNSLWWKGQMRPPATSKHSLVPKHTDSSSDYSSDWNVFIHRLFVLILDLDEPNN